MAAGYGRRGDIPATRRKLARSASKSRRLVAGDRVYQDQRVELRPGLVTRSDPCQIEVDQLDRRKVPGFHGALEFWDRRFKGGRRRAGAFRAGAREK
jgi:hypothetical protein